MKKLNLIRNAPSSNLQVYKVLFYIRIDASKTIK